MQITDLALAVRTAKATLEVYPKLGTTIKKASISIATLFTFALLSITANAAIFTVTNTNDAGMGSLRQAVLDANASAGIDAIAFSPTIFTPQQLLFINLQTEIPVTQDLQINVQLGRKLWISSTGNSRLFNVTNANVDISDVTLMGGRAVSPNNGGAILLNGGSLNLTNVTLFNNFSGGNGGAVHVQAGTLAVTNSTFSNNDSSAAGGAISINNANSTAVIGNSTFRANSAQTGGAISVTGGAVSILNSALGGNSAPAGPSIAGTINSLGYNIISDTAGATITGVTTGNQLNVNPGLASLADNGGNTWTIAFAPNSPAIDAGAPTQAGIPDQRGSRRGPDGNLNGVGGVDIGAYEKQKSAVDFDADGSADLSITRVSSGNLSWYSGIFVNESRPENELSPFVNRLTIQTFGFSTDVLAPADYDGDGRVDAAVFRPSTGIWYFNRSTEGFAAFQWGLAGDVPVPADYDGDGKADVAVFRAGVWYIYNSTLGYTGTRTLGSTTDRPVPADYDGDLKADVAVFGNGLWTVNKSTGGQISEFFGVTNDIPVPADYDGNGTDNLAIFRPSNGTWYIKRNAGGYDAAPFGLATDKLVPADYDGDGKVDIAVWRANTTSGRGEWYISQSRDGFFVANFGFSTDTPVANTRFNP